jgi:AbrB family looped-hinge helix DNA binding protein
MREFVSTITARGQVTIPREIRDQLGVSDSGKVAFILDESGKVELRPVRYTLSALRGIIPALPQADADGIDTQISDALAEGASKRQRF